MRIAIVGPGSMGAALGRRWAAAGHPVRFTFSRDPRRLDAVARSAAPLAEPCPSLVEAVEWAEVVVLTVPWPLVAEVLAVAGDALAGKIVVDATNPLNDAHTALLVGTTDSGGETVARWAPGARVIKAFNTVFARLLDPEIDLWPPEPGTVLICGDDAPAKQVVARLATDAGGQPFDAGPLARARGTEALALLEILYWQSHGRMISLRTSTVGLDGSVEIPAAAAAPS
jgi:predicted dinucleotide-binding enzyme